MIGDDQLQAELAGRSGLGHAGDAAIDCDHGFHSLLRQIPQGRAVEAVAVFEAMRDMEPDHGAKCLRAVSRMDVPVTPSTS